MSGFAPALASTIDVAGTAAAPLVVQFGDSIEELAALAELKANFPRATVVDFLSRSQIMSFAGPVIYVGHSSEEGIRYYGRIVPWEFLADLIRNSVSDAHYILGCESSKISELTQQSGKRVFSFEQKVDAILGSHIVSFLIARFLSFSNPFNFLLRGLNRLSLLEKGIQSPQYLYFSYEEKVMNTIFIVLSLFGLLFSAFSYWANIIKTTKSSSTLVRVAEQVDGIWSVVNAVIVLITTGQYTYSVVEKLTVGSVSLIFALIKTLSFWNQLAAIASLDVDLMAYFSPATIYNVISLLIASVSFILTVEIAMCDYNDPDFIFGNC